MTGSALVVLAMAAGDARAQSAVIPAINLVANQVAFCSFAAVPTLSNLINVRPYAVTSTVSTLDITDPINFSTGALNAASFTLTLPSVCNINSRIIVTSENGGLKPLGGVIAVAPDESFLASLINYTVLANWQDATLAGLATDGTPAASSVGVTTGPKAGNVTLQFHLDFDPINIVAAGNYSDVLHLQLEPQ